LIHHGGAVAERRLELMVAALNQLDDRFQLDLMLMPNEPRYFARLERLVAASTRVRLIAPVDQRTIVEACNSYDVGLYALPAANANLRLALPNKLFEFIQARLAVVIGPSPEMARVVREHDCGVVAHDFTPEALARAIANLSPELVDNYKLRSDRAAQLLNADRNRSTVLRLVERVLAD
jgi:glycosyltransferase involved in cell wall biosynthesis